jgi:hypothetical protein
MSRIKVNPRQPATLAQSAFSVVAFAHRLVPLLGMSVQNLQYGLIRSGNYKRDLLR